MGMLTRLEIDIEEWRMKYSHWILAKLQVTTWCFPLLFPYFFISVRFMVREDTEISTNHKSRNTSHDRVSTNHKSRNTSRDRVSTNHTVVHSTWHTLYFTWESLAAKWFNFLFTTTDTLHITCDTHDTRASVSTV